VIKLSAFNLPEAGQLSVSSGQRARFARPGQGEEHATGERDRRVEEVWGT